MKQEKHLLRQKFIELQRHIAELERARKKQEEAASARERGYLFNLFEILDGFESIEETIRPREGELDKTARLLVKNLRAVQKKIIRMLKANHITAIEFPDNKARMDYCIVVDTSEALDKDNETIVSVVKQGYLDEKVGIVLRKAEVITVLNP